MAKFVSVRQRDLFHALESAGKLIIAIGPQGISANYQGNFKVSAFDSEDRIEADDGTFHLHVDWNRLNRVSIDVIMIEDRHEGCITFFDKEERLFRLYRQNGPFSDEVAKFAGNLV